MASFMASRTLVTPMKRFASQPAIFNMAKATRVAGFHTSKKLQILPPGPQIIHGTINDPVPTFKPDPATGTYHWSFERLVSLGCIPLTIAPFAAGSLNPVMDAIVVSGLLLHSHMSFKSMIVDYIPHYRVPKFHTFLMWLLRAGTAVVGYGLYEIQTRDVGLTETIKRIWTA